MLEPSPNRQAVVCVVFISPWSTVNVVVVCVTFFFFSPPDVQWQQTAVQTVTDCPETSWTAHICLTTADSVHKHTCTHKQTATVKHAEVRPFDPVWLLTAAFYTTHRHEEGVSGRQRSTKITRWNQLSFLKCVNGVNHKFALLICCNNKVKCTV